MTQENKEILLKDLCARLPYGVKCSFGVDDAIYEICGINPVCCGASEIQATHIKSGINGDFAINACKPYLFPLSSMTEEQIYNNPIGFCQMTTIRANRDWEKITIKHTELCKLIDWFNKKHFDWRGLIEKGLAIDATGLNFY